MKTQSSRKTHASRVILAFLLAPFVMGLSPPDTSGTFLSLAGGTGRFSYSACGQVEIRRFKDLGATVDHRIRFDKDPDTISMKSYWPDYLTLGFGGGGTVIDSKEPMYLVGSHFTLDWKHLGIDVAGWNAFDGNDGMERMDTDFPVSPGLGIRIGERPYLSVAAFNSPIPGIMSRLAEAGIGTRTDRVGIWIGATTNAASTYAAARYSHLWKLGEIGLSLQGAPWGEGGLDYGVALSTTVRLAP